MVNNNDQRLDHTHPGSALKKDRRTRRAILTVDFEDYRRQELRDHLGIPQPPNPVEVEKQFDMLIDLLSSCDVRATFYSVGRLTACLKATVWQRIAVRHRIGCHGYEHERVSKQGPAMFHEDTHAAKCALEDASGAPVVSYRAPYFSNDGCDPWFGEVLAKEGFRVDSSRRINASRLREIGDTFWVPGAEGSTIEVPLPSVGVGAKRLTVIGGTYFRLLPLAVIRRLLERAEQDGFTPIVYLHPYDIDPTAPRLAYPRGRYWMRRGGAWIRRQGRETAGAKLRALSEIYNFEPVESVLSTSSESEKGGMSPAKSTPEQNQAPALLNSLIVS